MCIFCEVGARILEDLIKGEFFWVLNSWSGYAWMFSFFLFFWLCIFLKRNSDSINWIWLKVMYALFFRLGVDYRKYHSCHTFEYACCFVLLQQRKEHALVCKYFKEHLQHLKKWFFINQLYSYIDPNFLCVSFCLI